MKEIIAKTSCAVKINLVRVFACLLAFASCGEREMSEEEDLKQNKALIEYGETRSIALEERWNDLTLNEFFILIEREYFEPKGIMIRFVVPPQDAVAFSEHMQEKVVEFRRGVGGGPKSLYDLFDVIWHSLGTNRPQFDPITIYFRCGQDGMFPNTTIGDFKDHSHEP
ncbi:MAG: hypothetical protein QE274_01050 [Verrucomicrobiaceae bacterium]|nr:hypothetical protein [Verrucomicrobiaceae bacterium]